MAGDAAQHLLSTMGQVAAQAGRRLHLPRAQEKEPKALRPWVHVGVGTCRVMPLVCWQGEESRKALCTLHWPWL